jgi:predicted nucleic acid-binding protein
MKILLFDTSVWIDYLKGKIDERTDLLNEYLSNTDSLRICPVIIQEILQGIRDDNQFIQLSNDLVKLIAFPDTSNDAAVGAAKLYRNLRKKGITIRKPNDCLIAYMLSQTTSNWYTMTVILI